MSVQARIRMLQGSLYGGQRRVASIVLRRAHDLPLASVHEIARAAGVSAATVSRFARELGYSRFKEFRTALARDMRPPLETIYQSIEPEDSDRQIVGKVFAGHIQSLKETLAMIPHGDFVRVARTITKARRTVFFGVGSSGQIACDAALRLSHLDLNAEAATDLYGMINKALGLKRGDVAIGISHTGRSSDTIDALRLAAGRGATTVGISNQLKSPLHEVSDIFLLTSFPESRVKVAALTSRVAQVCLMDAFYLLVARYQPARLRKAEELNRVMEKLLRRPAR